MIILSQEVFDEEMTNTNLDLSEETAKATDEDPVCIEFVMACLERMASLTKMKKNSITLYIKYTDACNILGESLFSLRHLMNVQNDTNMEFHK